MKLSVLEQNGFVAEGDLRVLSYHLTRPKTEDHPTLNAYYETFLQRLEESVQTQGGGYGKGKLKEYLERGGVPGKFRPTHLDLMTQMEEDRQNQSLTVTQRLLWKDGRKILADRTECQTWDLSQKEPILCKKQRKERRKFHLPRLRIALWQKKKASSDES